MKIIRTDRGGGKTTALIKQAARDKSYILCHSKSAARYIYDTALGMGLNIPYPITVDDIPLRGYKGDILIDEIDYILPQLLGAQVNTITTSASIDTLDNNKSEIKINSKAN
ncbi:MAG: hypothetical protein GX982_07670 [Tissierellia bacterium]|nr:hypothetical protein [Tissierellia bacterium]